MGADGALGALGAGAPSAAVSSRPHSEHSVAVEIFISPQPGHLMRSSSNSVPHLIHFSAIAGLIIPQLEHVFGVEAAAGLKHIISLFRSSLHT